MNIEEFDRKLKDKIYRYNNKIFRLRKIEYDSRRGYLVVFVDRYDNGEFVYKGFLEDYHIDNVLEYIKNGEWVLDKKYLRIKKLERILK